MIGFFSAITKFAFTTIVGGIIAKILLRFGVFVYSISWISDMMEDVRHYLMAEFQNFPHGLAGILGILNFDIFFNCCFAAWTAHLTALVIGRVFGVR